MRLAVFVSIFIFASMGPLPISAPGAFAQKTTNPAGPEKYDLKTGTPVTNVVANINLFSPSTQSLLVAGKTPQSRHIFNAYPATQVEKKPTNKAPIVVPRNALFFDIGESPDGDLDALLLFTETGVLRYSPAASSFEPLVSAQSIFRRGSDVRFTRRDFAKDLNGDERFDIIIPEFDFYRVFLQQPDGSFPTETRIEMPVEQRFSLFGGNDGESGTQRPIYSEFPHYVFDINKDERPDLIFHRGKEFLVFAGTPDGFAPTPQKAALPSTIRGNRWEDDVRASEENFDQSKFLDTVLDAFEDINGDDIPDIVSETNRASGVFNRTSTYAVHYGRISNGLLSFSNKPNSEIAVDGIAANYWLADVDDDGRKDFIVAAFKMNLRKIVSALVTGATSMQLQFHVNKIDGFSYDKKLERKLAVDLDLSKGTAATPVVQFADINGDGANDLVLADKDSVVEVFEGGKTPFKKTLASIKTDLPDDGNLVRARDVDNDGRSDIVVRFNRFATDGEANRDRVTIVKIR